MATAEPVPRDQEMVDDVEALADRIVEVL
jgi:hypothetical protein